MAKLTKRELCSNEEFISKVNSSWAARRVWNWLGGKEKVSWEIFWEARKECLNNQQILHPIGPIESRDYDKKEVDSKESSIETSVFLSDIHIPHQDKKAVAVSLKLIEDLQPSHIFLNGDIIDMYQCSRYSKNPSRALEIQEDLDELTNFFGQLREVAPKAKITYLEGNHENRIIRYLYDHPEIAKLKSLQPKNLLGLEDFDIEWIPASKTHLYHGTVITHGDVVRSSSGQSAKGQYDKYGTSGISGHTHRAGVYYHSDFSGDSFWVESGCLCELNPEYVTGKPNWQQALAVGSYSKEIGKLKIELIQITNGKLVYSGKLHKNE